MRIVTAFFSAPLVVAGGWSTYAFSESPRWSEKLVGFVISMVLSYVYCVIVTAVIALPLFLLLRRFDLVRGWVCLLLGAAISWLFTMLFMPKVIHAHSTWLGLLGGLAGLTFWAIAKSDLRPGKSPERT